MVKLQCEDEAYINNCIDSYMLPSISKGIGETFVPSLNSQWAHCSGVIIWHPLNDPQITLKCPIHGSGLYFEEKWNVPSRSTTTISPIKIYNLGRNLLLVSALYRCKHCDSVFRGHDLRILDQLPKKVPEFQLCRKVGVSLQTLTLIVNLCVGGVSFKEMENIFVRSYVATKNQVQAACGTEETANISSVAFSNPSSWLLRDLFLLHYNQRRHLYQQQLCKYSPTQMSLDHTFRLRYISFT